jgi:hypothetical protein
MPFWGKRVLQRPGCPPYMIRYHLFLTRWVTIYLNVILTPDHDTRLHTHPWKRAYSLKLWGWYWEQLSTGFRIPGRLSRIPKSHRIVSLSEAAVWTLFIGLGPKRPWGFLNPDGTTDYRT